MVTGAADVSVAEELLTELAVKDDEDDEDEDGEGKGIQEVE
jgi:hypothetical protein